MLPRLFLLTLVLFCLEMGLFLLVLPWSGLWEHNYFLFRYPEFAAWLMNNRLRGLISGLGLVDIGLACWYAAHFRLVLAGWLEATPPPLPRPAQPRESLSRGQTA
ncbi:MAG: hypothetical protein ACRD35_01765 [Candidatus Acidiferrales bacterium]